MITFRNKPLWTFILVILGVFLFVQCNEDDTFDDETFDSDEFRVIKVSANGETLSEDDMGILGKGLVLEIVFSDPVNESELLSALSISNSASYTTSFDETGSILTATLDDLVYASDYTITLPAGDYGANGKSLEEDFALTFTTSPLIIPEVLLSTSENTVDEGASVDITATLSEITTEPVEVTLGFAGSAVKDSDFTSNNTITIPASEQSASTSLSATDDTEVEGAEDIIVSIESIVNGEEDGEQTATISLVDNDVASDLELKGVLALEWSGSGTNDGKAVHVRAKTDIPDLSVYSLGVANNGGGTDGIEYTFPDISVSAGDDILVAREKAALETYFGSLNEFDEVLDANSSISQNGDDAIELFSGTTLIETYGDADVDGTGEPWEYDDSWAYKLGDEWIVGGVGCATSSTNMQDSDCIYPIFLNALQIQGVMSLELETRDRAIHLRANRDIADLSVYGIGIANNGGGSDGREMDLPSISVQEGDHILFMRGQDEATITTYFGACFSKFDHTATDTGSDINFNGDDGVELFENTTSIEIYGSVEDDGTGLFWEFTGSWGYKEAGEQYIYGGVDCTAPGTTNATSGCPYPFCE